MFGVRKQKAGAESKTKPYEKKRKKAAILAVCAIVVLVVVFAVAMLAFSQQHRMAIISESNCGLSGGTWNECGSPCLGSPQGTMCIAMCQPQCEWFSQKALAVKNDLAYNIEPGFRCVTQPNGIEMCWLPEKGFV